MVNLCARSSLMVNILHMIIQKIQALKKGGKTLPSTFEVSSQCLPGTYHHSIPVNAICEHTTVTYRCEKQTKILRTPVFVKFTAKSSSTDTRVNLDTCTKLGPLLFKSGKGELVHSDTEASPQAEKTFQTHFCYI